MKKYYHPFSLFLVFIPLLVLSACGQSHQVSTVGAISSTSIQNAPDYPAPLSPSVIPPPRASETPITQSSAPSLLNASPEEVGRVALQVTESRFPSLSGQSQLALAAPVTPDDLLAYGLPSEDAKYCTNPASLMLVIVKGDFNMTSLAGPVPLDTSLRAHYVIYVFDLPLGVPITVTYSTNGGILRHALNDPSLPDDPTAPPLDRPTANGMMPPLATPVVGKMCT